MFQVLLFAGLMIRLLLIPLAGFKADVAFWKGWGLAAADHGVVWMIQNTNYNYPPGFSYVLWFINKTYAFFKSPYQISDYWNSTNILYLFLIKLITIVADLCIVFLIIKIVQKIGESEKSEKSGRSETSDKSDISGHSGLSGYLPLSISFGSLGTLFALFYFLNPAVIYDGAVWGQVDQVGLLFFLASAYFLLKKRLAAATIFFTLSYLLKFQSIIFIPLYYLYILKSYSFRDAVKSGSVALVVFLVVTFPFLIGHQMDSIIRLLLVNFDWFPWYSLNAFNIWWLASGLNGMGLTDKHLVLGLLSAKQAGFYLFTFVYFIAVVTLFLGKKEEATGNFLKSCGLVVFAFFMLLTQSHERYLFPLVGLLPLIWVYESHRSHKTNGTNRFLVFSIFYLLLSIFFFFNMYLSMGWNYPDQVVPAFTRQSTLGLSALVSYVQIVFFFVFFFWFFSKEIIRHIRLIGIMGIFLFIMIFIKHIPYLTGKPIPLTVFKPIGSRQDYLEPVPNRAVESGRGVSSWNRLSDNYFFYDRGIGSHANSEITYHLNGMFSRFSTDFGIDTEGHESAKVVYAVFGDNRELYRSKIMGRFDFPGTMEIDVSGVKFLTLKIEKAGESNYGAHADWLNPQLIK